MSHISPRVMIRLGTISAEIFVCFVFSFFFCCRPVLNFIRTLFCVCVSAINSHFCMLRNDNSEFHLVS